MRGGGGGRPVLITWSRVGQPMYMKHTGSIVNIDDVVWHPFANPEAAQEAAQRRWRQVTVRPISCPKMMEFHTNVSRVY